MKIDFQIDDVKYCMDFDDVAAKAFQRTYGYDNAFILIINPNPENKYKRYQVRTKGISSGKIMWHKYQDNDLPNRAINYCEKVIKLLVFG